MLWLEKQIEKKKSAPALCNILFIVSFRVAVPTPLHLDACAHARIVRANLFAIAWKYEDDATGQFCLAAKTKWRSQTEAEGFIYLFIFQYLMIKSARSQERKLNKKKCSDFLYFVLRLP